MARLQLFTHLSHEVAPYTEPLLVSATSQPALQLAIVSAELTATSTRPGMEGPGFVASDASGLRSVRAEGPGEGGPCSRAGWRAVAKGLWSRRKRRRADLPRRWGTRGREWSCWFCCRSARPHMVMVMPAWQLLPPADDDSRQGFFDVTASGWHLPRPVHEAQCAAVGGQRRETWGVSSGLLAPRHQTPLVEG